MKEVYILIEAYEGQDNKLDVYGSIGDAVNQASELASLYGWNKVEGLLRWEEPDAWYNFIEVQAHPVK